VADRVFAVTITAVVFNCFRIFFPTMHVGLGSPKENLFLIYNAVPAAGLAVSDY